MLYILPPLPVINVLFSPWSIRSDQLSLATRVWYTYTLGLSSLPCVLYDRTQQGQAFFFLLNMQYEISLTLTPSKAKFYRDLPKKHGTEIRFIQINRSRFNYNCYGSCLEKTKPGSVRVKSFVAALCTCRHRGASNEDSIGQGGKTNLRQLYELSEGLHV